MEEGKQKLLQETGPSGLSFARGRPLQMINNNKVSEVTGQKEEEGRRKRRRRKIDAYGRADI